MSDWSVHLAGRENCLAGFFCCAGTAPVAHLSAMNPVSVECPNCQVAISNLQIAGESALCSACGNWFALTPNQLAELMEKPAPAGADGAAIRAARPGRSPADKVRTIARNFVVAAGACFIVAAFIFAVPIVSAATNGEGFPGLLDWLLPGAVLVAFGLCLYLIGRSSTSAPTPKNENPRTEFCKNHHAH